MKISGIIGSGDPHAVLGTRHEVQFVDGPLVVHGRGGRFEIIKGRNGRWRATPISGSALAIHVRLRLGLVKKFG